MAIPLWGVSPKYCVVSRLRLIVACDLEAPDARNPAFPFAFRRHSSAPRKPAARRLSHCHNVDCEAAPLSLTGRQAVTGCSESVGSGKGSRHRERRENARLPTHLARIFASRRRHHFRPSLSPRNPNV